MRVVQDRILPVLLMCLVMMACGDKQPPSPEVGSPGGEVQVSGNERIGWSQPADDAGQVASLQFVIYVDGVRTPLTGLTCSSTPTASGFDCSAPLPPLTPGSHTLELASVVVDDTGVLESGRSAPLRVVVRRISGSSSLVSPLAVTTVEGSQLVLEPVTDGLAGSSDIAFAGDGVMFVAERGGIVRAIRKGALVPEPALDLSSEVALPNGGLLAITLDSKYEETRFLYALYAIGAPRGGLEFILARFRGTAEKFAERAILLDRVPASPAGASGALRVGPDGKLYVAFDSAADDLTPASYASYNGKILRLSADATTPDDQPNSTPILSLDHPQPVAFDWQPVSGHLWAIDVLDGAAGRLSAVRRDAAQPRGAALRTSYALPPGTGASSAAFYDGDLMPMFRGDLFIGADEGRQLLRLRFDRDNPTRITSVERLLREEIGPVRVVANGPEGALYIASDTTLYRLRP
jgi:glucose/arabinose dehydrogenase